MFSGSNCRQAVLTRLSSSSIAMSSLNDLPGDVLKHIMQLLSLQDRLTSCCLVSRRIHAVAAAATQSLTVGDKAGQIPAQRAESVLEWLPRYGQHLTQLQLLGFVQQPWPGLSQISAALQQLPCQNLHDLCIRCPCSMRLGAASGCPGVIQVCTKLTRLEIHCGAIMDAYGGDVIDCLSTLVHLRHLHVVQDWSKCKILGLCGATLPRLQHLTYLRVQSLSFENLQQLGPLTNLHELVVEVASNTAVSPSSVPGLAFPAALRKVSVVSLVDVGILSLLPMELEDLHLSCDLVGPSEGPGSFVSCIARMQHLTSLVMAAGQGFGPEWPPAGPAYSALTASTDLVRLELYNPPGGIWQYVFSAARNLPHLTSFTFGSAAPSPFGAQEFVPPLPWVTGDLTSLVSCCSSLCSIDGIWVEHGPYVSELRKLTALTNLGIKYDFAELESIDESIAYLSGFPKLQCMRLTILEDLSEHSGLPPATLLPLTNLGFLTCLEYRCTPGDHPVRAEYQEFRLLSQEHQCSGRPDVWLQLLRRTIEDFECPDCGRSAALGGLGVQLDEDRKVIDELQQQVSDQQQQLSEKEQQLLEQQQLVAVQQQQLAAQQELIADLQQQLAEERQQRQVSAQQQDVLIDDLQAQLQGLHLGQ